MSKNQSVPKRAKVRHLSAHSWQPRAELQASLGISRRTFFRRIDTGSIERQGHGRAALYRLAPKSATGGTDGTDGTDGMQAAPNPVDGWAMMLSRLESQAVELAALRKQLEAQSSALAEAERQRGLWEARARRWRLALKKNGLV